MATIQQVQNAVKRAPHYRVTCGALEVIGAPGAARWTFDYIVRRENGRGAYGKRNAVEYLATLASDTPIENVTFEKRGASETLYTEKRDARVTLSRVALNDWRMDVEVSAVTPGAWRNYDSAKGYASRSAALAHASGYFGIHVVENDARGMAEQAELYAACVAHVEKRKAMIAANRERAALLRNRAWSDVALDNRAFHAFALAGDRDGITARVDSALRMVPRFVRQYDMARTINRDCVAGPREAWRGAWSDARRMAKRRGA